MEQSGRRFEETNWLSAKTHLRRLFLPDRSRVFAPGHYGRACPIETPEGPNTGRVLCVSLGADIVDGRLVVHDADPVAGYGLGAHMVPFLEHDDPTRLLMGVNMMRQWLSPPDPEPALVQTGFEPDDPGFWCGRNLLTAYVSLGIDTFEDAIVVSESAASRLKYPAPLEAGDKLSNRHGSKGVVSRILPDAEMPHLEDGTPVDVVFDCMGLFSRMTVGQVREAVTGLAAHAEGVPAIIPPFQAPNEAELRARLAKAGLPEDGRTQLYLTSPPASLRATSPHHPQAGTRSPCGEGSQTSPLQSEGTNTASGEGCHSPIHPLTHSPSHPTTLPQRQPLERRSTVGRVYWGKLDHRAESKIQAAVAPGRCQRQGALEFYSLKTSGAWEMIREQFNTRAADRDDASTLVERVAAGPIQQAAAPSPRFAQLARRLAAAGIEANLTAEGLAFRLAPPPGETLALALPIAHPWLREHAIAEVGVCPELPEYRAVVEANSNLARILAASFELPKLSERAIAGLEAAVRALFDTLATPEHLRFGARVLFSGRAVTVPSADLRHDRVAIPEEIAWTLFGPVLQRDFSAEEVIARSEAASNALDELMARSWVVLHRAPVVEPMGLIAFHARRDPGRVIRIPPFANHGMNADFDGDVLSVFLPLTEAAQKEAGERLSIAGHLRRDPEALAAVQPLHGARYGLALLGRTPEGRAEISRLVGVEVHPIDGIVGRQSILNATKLLMEAEGVDATLAALERLMARGYERARHSGLSMPPFGTGAPAVTRPPETGSARSWEQYQEETIEKMLAERDNEESALFPFLFSALCGARGTLAHAPRYFAGFGVVENVLGKRVPIRSSLYDGMTPEEHHTVAVGSRRGIALAVRELDQITRTLWERFRPTGLNVLDRAMRSPFPGIVFARAAASGEVDPLTSVESRLFVGL